MLSSSVKEIYLVSSQLVRVDDVILYTIITPGKWASIRIRVDAPKKN